jgi:hypothetical protein
MASITITWNYRWKETAESFPGGVKIVSPVDAEEAKKDGLTAAAEYVKYTLALGTGALVFSAGLLSTNTITLTPSGKVCLLLSWALFGVSIALGVFALAIVPGKLAAKTYDLNDKLLTFPTILHQVAFVSGVICLGVTLVTTLYL